jgi:hypothetical protein
MRVGGTVVVFLLAGVAPAMAQEEWPRLNVYVGAQIADFGTELQVDARGSVLGSLIDFERDLGFSERASMASVSGLWRISKRNQIIAAYNYIGRDVAQHQLDRTISFGGETFHVNADIGAFIDTAFLAGTYRFAIVATPTVEVGPTIGVTVIRLKTGIDLRASVSGSTDTSQGISEDAKFTAPALLPGGFINVRPHPRVTIRGAASYISADFGDIDGEMFETFAGVDVMVLKWLGVGGSYSYNNLSVSVEDSSFDGSIDYSFSGPVVYGVLAF